MTLINATSSSSPNEIAIWKSYSGSYWSAVRIVGWIAQDTVNLKTTLYFKWQIGADNYWPYWKDSHQYSVSLGGSTVTISSDLPQSTNEWRDLCSQQKITVSHNSTTGEYSGTLSASGYKCWEAISGNYNISFPTITPPSPDPGPDPEPPDDPSVPVVNDLDPRYYILCDDKIVYSVNDELHTVIDPKLNLKLNQTDSLSFQLPPTNEMYSSISKLRSTIEVRQGSEILFRGRVLDDTSDFYNRKDVQCEGALAFLGDTVMTPYAEGDYTNVRSLFKAVISKHRSQVPSSTPYRKLKYVRCENTSSITMSNDEYSNSNDVISKLIEETGGFLKLEYYDTGETGISYLSTYDHTSSQIIDFGENLLDFSQFIDASSVYTSVLALGKKDENTGKRLTTGTGSAMYTEDADAIAKYGRIIKIAVFDEITDQSDLQTLARVTLALGVNDAVTITISAIDLHIVNPEIEKIRLGDAVRIRSIPHKVDAYFQCSAIDIDIQNPQNTTYTFGNPIKELTDKTK